MSEPQAVIPGPIAIQPAWLAQPDHAPDRRRFSVLCHRGWCDNEFRDQAINALVEGLSGAKAPVTKLPARSCPFPQRCDHECHDAELGWPRHPCGRGEAGGDPVSKPNGGIATRSQRALSHALRSELTEAACEVAWLTDGQLDRLILACHELADVAAAERRGREPS